MELFEENGERLSTDEVSPMEFESSSSHLQDWERFDSTRDEEVFESRSSNRPLPNSLSYARPRMLLIFSSQETLNFRKTKWSNGSGEKVPVGCGESA